MSDKSAKIAIIMGSKSDWPIMQNAASILEDFNIKFETKVVSAHRTPNMMFDFAENAQKNGFKVIIAGAGGPMKLPRYGCF
jgi:Phosphoribosylcarboxyaminoimidazole (NCAIR) mutase